MYPSIMLARDLDPSTLISAVVVERMGLGSDEDQPGQAEPM